MRYSKEERHYTYILALERYKGGDFNGICEVIADILCYPDGLTIKDFPEIVKHKPKRKGYNNYWWPNDTEEGRDKRINVLKQAIEETK